jgi:alpha-galactosidase
MPSSTFNLQLSTLNHPHKAAEDLYPTWEKNRDQWNLTGGDHPYHYLGSATWFTRIGHAMAEAMTETAP